MKYYNKGKNNSGITLIALIITIIVLLILAAVTLNMVIGNNGIFSKAQKASDETNKKDEEEKISMAFADLNIDVYAYNKTITIDDIKNAFKDENVEITECDADGKELSSIVRKIASTDGISGLNSEEQQLEYVKILFKKTNNWYIVHIYNGKVVSSGNGSKKNEIANEDLVYNNQKIKVGDYVNYKPKPESSTYTTLKSENGNKDQTITYEENLKWRVYNIDENGNLILISDEPTENKIFFEGNIGYNNCVYILNDMCKKLYSNSSNGSVARNLNIEDIESVMDKNFWDYSKDFISYHKVPYGRIEKFDSSNLIGMHYPEMLKFEKDQKVNSETGTKYGVNEQDELISTSEFNKATELEVKQTFWSKPVDKNYFINPTYFDLIIPKTTFYALASRCVDFSTGEVADGVEHASNESYICYSIRHVSCDGNLIDAWNLCMADGTKSVNNTFQDKSFRPVVKLGNQIQLESDSATHNTADTAWNIK